MLEATYIDTHADYIQENTLMKLAHMATLKDNWNGYGAEPLIIKH